MFETGKDLLSLAEERNVAISQIVLEYECKDSQKTEQEILQRMQYSLDIMKETSIRALKKPQSTMGGFISGDAKKMMEYSEKADTLSGVELTYTMAMALSNSEVNASMGRICAAPTAGACGILPAAILHIAKKKQLEDNKLIKGLLTAAGIGILIEHKATISGAAGGCQAECGTASAMAAAALVELSGGTPSMVLAAASFALINIMGLICDPVAGLVEMPCALRNASGVCNALSAADMALAGIESLIPFDEVVVAMDQVGKMMPYQLKETALGGIAATATGKHLEEEFYQNKE